MGRTNGSTKPTKTARRIIYTRPRNSGRKICENKRVPNVEYKKKGRDGVRAANARMKAEGKGIFAPGVQKMGARAGGQATKKLGVGVFAPGVAAQGWRAAGLDKLWDDPVFRESARWRRSKWKSSRG